ncbi:MAG: FAD-dependent oxidoreductase, partial [Actinomycetota bacterium]
GYSPCGIPYVHGKEIPSFDNLILQGKDYYAKQGFDIRYQTGVEKVDTGNKRIVLDDGEKVPYDRLILATGFTYADPGVPGMELGSEGGLYFVKNIRRAMEWDKFLDTVKSAVVQEASPLGLEMTTALPHRGIETHLVDPHPWALAEVADPDIMQPVQDSWEEAGVTMHFNTKVEAYLGEGGKVRAVRTSEGEIPVQLVVICTHKRPNTRLAREAGITIGSTGGIVVDELMATSEDEVWAAGDCVELPHGVSSVPIQGLSGSHAYAQGKVAGTNAGGGRRRYQPVFVPWGMVAGKWMIGGVSFGETLATALGIPFVMGVATGISRARYYPDMKKVRVKLLADPRTLRIIGAQMVGGEGIKERADFLGMCVRKGVTLEDLATMENVYSPPIGALNEPIALAAQNGMSQLGRT